MRTFVLIRDLDETGRQYLQRDHVIYQGQRYVIGDRHGRLSEPELHSFELLPLPDPVELKLNEGATLIVTPNRELPGGSEEEKD